MTALPTHRTKIVCTLGPASESPEMLGRMILAGMSIARLNLSHGDFDRHRKVIRKVRSVAASCGRRVAILADLPGPKIRIGRLAHEPLELEPGGGITLTTEDVPGDRNRVTVNFAGLTDAVREGDTLFLNDGFIQLEVVAVKVKEVRCRVLVGGEIRSRVGLNLPGIDLGISAFTPHDLECLRFAAEENLDAVSQSFVETAADVRTVREAAQGMGYQPFIIAKIERAGALGHTDAILEAADGIMIARGDLGVEMPIEQIAVVQKKLMLRANLASRPVITATQMLESMIGNKRPTRAEATDVANAILDGTDCVMLSGESAVGKYPEEAVRMLSRIAAATEHALSGSSVTEVATTIQREQSVNLPDLIALSVRTTLERITPAAVFVPTRSGATARSISRFRLPVWIIGVSSQETTCQKMQFSYGVYPVCERDHPEDWRGYIKKWLGAHGVQGDLAILTEGPSTRHPEANNRMEIIDLRGGKSFQDASSIK